VGRWHWMQLEAGNRSPVLQDHGVTSAHKAFLPNTCLSPGMLAHFRQNVEANSEI
jgi:hypothetical protein